MKNSRLNRFIVAVTYLLLSLLGATGHAANKTQSQYDFETQIQKRVLHVISQVDPSALVTVKLNLKQINSSLPFFGADTKITPLVDGELSTASLQGVQIKVVTQIEEVPDWVKQQVTEAVALDGVPVNFSYEKAKGQGLSVTGVVQQKLWPLFEKAVETTEGMSWKFTLLMLVLVLTLAATLSSIAYGIFNSSKKLEAALSKVIEEKLVPAMNNIQPAAPVQQRQTSSSSAEKSSAPAVAPIANDGADQNEFSQLPVHCLESLIADCYWTEKDGYANYIWGKLAVSQREQILKTEKVDQNYFTHFIKTAPTNLGYHRNPWYMQNDNHFTKVDQKDLQQWLITNPSAFTLVSPLRLEELNLPLEMKIDLLTGGGSFASGNGKGPATPPNLKASPLRSLGKGISLGRISLDDENYILQHADKFDRMMRSQIRSLVWLALCPEGVRSQALSELDARQLSTIWYGHDEVLKTLKSTLPPKKQEMLDHFRYSVNPSREDEAYIMLADYGRDLYEEYLATQAALNSDDDDSPLKKATEAA